jgi:hypothetical protein
MATRSRFQAAPAGFAELGADLRDVNVSRVARRLDRVVERDTHRHRDDDADKVKAERGGDPGKRRRPPVREAGRHGEDQGPAERGDHEPGVDDGPVGLLEGGDEGAVAGLAQAGHDRVRVEGEGAGHHPHGENGAHQGGEAEQRAGHRGLPRLSVFLCRSQVGAGATANGS